MSERPAAVTAAGQTARRYHYWTGRSGRQYVHGIYDPSELPHFAATSVVMVVREGHGRRAVDVAATGASAGLFFHGRRYASALARGVNELHLHIADDPQSAAAAAADLAGAVAAQRPAAHAGRQFEPGIA